jgi:hypothetical protein
MLNVICLKHGNKYGPDYVNRLYNMVQRHLTVPYRFVCFTDNSLDINPNIEIRQLPKDDRFAGWWWKPYLFKQDHFDNNDTILFFDLDMVIVGNIDKLISFNPNEFVGLSDVSRIFPKQTKKLGSAVMRWPAGKFSNVWKDLESFPDTIRKYRGDQDWIWNRCCKHIKFYPDSWIVSYKWEVRKKDELVRQDGRYRFRNIRNVDLNPETAVLAFHGSPDPHEVMDPVIVDNWQ